MKAVIPVAGAGTQLRPLTYTQPKPMIPVAGKPIIAFIMDQLIEAGIRDFVFILGYLGDKIRNYVENNYPDIKSEFVFQEKRLGLGHAIFTAKECIAEQDEILIMLGDTILDIDMDAMLSSQGSCLAIKKVRDPRNFGVVEFGRNGEVTKVVEKPQIPKSNMALVGMYKIAEVGALLDSLDHLIMNEQKTHGEYHLTDALMMMIDGGINFTCIEADNWFDCGKKEILLETNAKLLDRQPHTERPTPVFVNTIIIEPVYIGKDCQISNSIIGPHVTIGDNTIMDYSIVKESIIGNYAMIKEVVLENSVVGNDAAIHGLCQSLNIGDNTEIDFG